MNKIIITNTAEKKMSSCRIAPCSETIFPMLCLPSFFSFCDSGCSAGAVLLRKFLLSDESKIVGISTFGLSASLSCTPKGIDRMYSSGSANNAKVLAGRIEHVMINAKIRILIYFILLFANANR